MHTICSDDDSVRDYNKLFDKGYQDIDDLQSQFNDAFGQSYAMMDPTMLDLVSQARISATSGPDLEPRRDICSSDSFASAMRLDQIVRLLLFNTHNSLIASADTFCLASVRRSLPVSSPWYSKHAD